MTRRRVVIEIDRLVVDGHGRAEAHALSAALERALARALEGPATTEALGAGETRFERVDAGQVPWSASEGPERVAAAVGRAVAGAVLAGAGRGWPRAPSETPRGGGSTGGGDR